MNAAANNLTLSSDSGIHSIAPSKPKRVRKPRPKATVVAAPVVLPTPALIVEEAKSLAPRVAGGRQKEPNGVVDEVIIATADRNRLATTLGFILGGFVPLGSFTVAHYELSAFTLANWAPILMVFGGLAYSALTVYEWGVKAFENKLKALGFVLLIEGIMTLSGIKWLSIAALVLLVSINGISTGTKLALKRTL